jgi:hypothetical protein
MSHTPRPFSGRPGNHDEEVMVNTFLSPAPARSLLA